MLHGTVQGWNLVGNPYPSPIDWDAASGWTKTNVDNATYRHVNNATWASYVGGVGTNGGSQIYCFMSGFLCWCYQWIYIWNTQYEQCCSYPQYFYTFFKDEVSDYRKA